MKGVRMWSGLFLLRLSAPASESDAAGLIFTWR